MFKLVLGKAEEPEIKLPTSAGSWKKQASSRKTSISALLTMPKPLTVVDHNKLWKILQEMGIPDHLTCLLRTADTGPNQKAPLVVGLACSLAVFLPLWSLHNDNKQPASRITATGRGGRQGPQHWSHLDTQEHSFRSPRFPTISHSHTNLVNLPFPSATCVANTTPSPHPDCLPLPQQTVSWPCTPQWEGREEEKGLSTLKYSAGPEAS